MRSEGRFDARWLAVAAVMALGGAAAFPGCADPPVASCADSLSGVWVADDLAPSGERVAFHIVDPGGGDGSSNSPGASNNDGADNNSSNSNSDGQAGNEPARVTLYPMYNAGVPPDPDLAGSDNGATGGNGAAGAIVYAPPVFHIDRLGGRPGQPGRVLVGTRTQRVTRDGAACILRRQASIRDCADNALTLAWIASEIVAWDTCQARAEPRFTRVVLRRARP